MQARHMLISCLSAVQTIDFRQEDPTQPAPTTLLISARERRVEGPAGTDTYDHDPPTKLGAIPSPTGSHPATLLPPQKLGSHQFSKIFFENLLPLTQVGSGSILARLGSKFLWNGQLPVSLLD